MESPKAWIALICILALVLIVNLPLLFILITGKQPKITINQNSSLYKSLNTMRKPWQSEDSQMDELAEKVKDLKKPPTANS